MLIFNIFDFFKDRTISSSSMYRCLVHMHSCMSMQQRCMQCAARTLISLAGFDALATGGRSAALFLTLLCQLNFLQLLSSFYKYTYICMLNTMKLLVAVNSLSLSAPIRKVLPCANLKKH